MKQLRRFEGNERILALFMLSLVIRFTLAYFYIIFFDWVLLPPFPWDQLIIGTLEPYLDYKLSYKKFIEAFISGDWIPYASEVSDPILASYVYPPLFLYTLSLFGVVNQDFIFIPLLFADILTSVVIYLFLDYSHGKEVAQWGFLATAFCPISIFYNSGLLFNTSLVTFFFIISLYLTYKKRFKWATFTLGLAFLYKQIILFFIIPVFMFNVLKSTEDKITQISLIIKIGIHSSILVGTFLVGSLPWLLLIPNQYLGTLFMGQQVTFSPTFIPPSVTWPAQWYSFLIELEVPYWVLYIVGFLNFTMLGLLMLQLANIFLLVHWYSKDSLDWHKFLDLIVYNAFLNHLLLPRGVYKYYFTFHVPLVVLWICFNFVSLTTKQKQFLVIFLGISLFLLFVHRLFYLLIIWIVFFSMLSHDLNIKDMKEYDPRLFQE